jgi:Zn-dependent alcohol dehydrogenase
VDLYRQGRLLIDEMITEEVPLADINHGFELLKRGEATRVVTTMGVGR